MRTREADWFNTETMETMYGFQVYHDGKWRHVAENGKPQIFATAAERDAKRREYQAMKSLPMQETQG